MRFLVTVSFLCIRVKLELKETKVLKGLKGPKESLDHKDRQGLQGHLAK